MKLVKTASGKETIRISKSEWENIGKTAGWLRKAQTQNPKDDQYLQAVNAGNETVAQQMVDKMSQQNGYGTRDWYHGTSGNFTSFDIGKGRGGSSGQSRNVIYVTGSTNTASQFGSNVLRLRVKITNPFDYRNSQHQQLLQQWMPSSKKATDFPNNPEYLANLQEEAKKGSWEILEDPNIQSFIRQGGFDSYYANEDELDAGTLGIFNPAMVKSAKPVTKDNNGKVIPVSQRFNSSNSDMRY